MGERRSKSGKQRMPLGKYYCDYCDKQFQDTPAARRRHLQGSQHHRSKALWYQSFPPTTHSLCNRFLQTGVCQYGDSCNYLHPTNNPQNSAPQGVGVAIERSSLPGVMMQDNMGRNLPPSLKPPPEGGYPPLPFVDWG